MAQDRSDASPDALRPEDKRALLKQLLARRIGASEFPLSHGQRALWLFHVLAPDMAAYHVAIVASASPSLNRELLSRSLDVVIARHAALRTIITAPDGVPMQRSGERLTCDVAVIDASGATAERLLDMVTSEYRRPFDLGTSPFRVSIFRADDRDVLLVTVHHVVFDATSAQIFFEELRTVYEALTRDEPPSLPPVAANYRDFVQAQSNFLASSRGEDSWNYWKARLSSAPPALVVPARPRPATPRYRGASVPLGVGPQHHAALSTVAREQRGTFVAVLLAAYSLLLRGLTGQEDMVIGMPVSGRTRPEWGGVIGYFVNMLPLRLAMPGDVSFREHVTRTAEELRNALAHQDFPFPLMVERLKVPRVVGRSPVFQAVLNAHSTRGVSDFGRIFDPDADEPITFGSSALRPFRLPQQEGQFDLTMELMDAGDRLTGRLKYNSDWVTADDGVRMAAAFDQLVAYVAVHADAPLSTCPTCVLPAAATMDEDRDRIEL